MFVDRNKRYFLTPAFHEARLRKLKNEATHGRVFPLTRADQTRDVNKQNGSIAQSKLSVSILLRSFTSSKFNEVKLRRSECYCAYVLVIWSAKTRAQHEILIHFRQSIHVPRVS